MENITDITIYESGSGGEMALVNDDFASISGLSNQVYLSLFGGNKEQSTSEDLDQLVVREDWWGNNLLDDENQFNSLFEKTIRNITLNTNGLSILKDAADSDLEHLKKYANIETEISIIGLKRIQLLVYLQEPDNISSKIKMIWDGTRNELIENIIL